MEVLHIRMQKGCWVEVGKAHWREGLSLLEGLVGANQIGEQQQVMWVEHMGT